MSFKGAVKAIPAKNRAWNNWFYRAFGSNTPYMNRLVDECASIDSVQDVTALREFRSRVEREGVPYYSTDANWSNAHIYGIWESLFGGTDVPLWQTPSVEHGLIFYEDVFTDVRYTARPVIATFGDYRRRIIRRFTDRPIFCVGPYVAYAEDYYDQETLARIKARLGRTLLVFPTHSTNDSEVTQDQRRFIQAVDEAAQGFDSVLVSAFWWNVDDPLIHALESRGYQIASAGFRDDTRFLSRLKAIISLCDYAVGDSMGTHIGYVLAEGKPYCHLRLGTKVSSFGAREQNQDSREVLKDELLGGLSKADKRSRGVALTEPYWGYSYLRSGEDLRLMAELSQEIARRAQGWTSRYGSAARRLLGGGWTRGVSGRSC